MCVLTVESTLTYPSILIVNEVGIGELDIPGKTLGKDKCFGVINGKVAPGYMTCFRISTDDSYGVIKTYVREEAVNKYLPWELKQFSQ